MELNGEVLFLIICHLIRQKNKFHTVLILCRGIIIHNLQQLLNS